MVKKDSNMRTINVVLERDIHKKLSDLKGDKTWYDFLRDMVVEK